MGTQKNRLIEIVLLSFHNIDKKIDKILLGNIVAFSPISLFVLHIGTMFLADTEVKYY